MKFEIITIIICGLLSWLFMNQAPAQAQGKLTIHQVPVKYKTMDDLLEVETVKEHIINVDGSYKYRHNANMRPIDGKEDSIDIAALIQAKTRIYADR